MKSLFNIAIVFFLFTTIAKAQDEEENIGFNQYSSSVFDSKENTLNLVSKIPSNPNQVNAQNQITNGILIQQIGDYNNFNANLQAEKVAISVSQNGNDNLISLDKQADVISQRIIQQGENNTVTDFTYYTKYDVNMEMVQQGNNQSIQNYGTNSLSKDMKVTQTGNGASVIIINQ